MKLSDVEVVVQAVVSATQPEKTWPPALRVLTRWASDQARSRHSQQQRQQQQEEQQQAQELLTRATAAVLAALEQAAADAAESGAAQPGALAGLGPGITFLAAAVPAVTAAAGQLQQQAVAAACCVLAALTPALLLEPAELQLVLSSCAQLLAACLAAPHLLTWLLSCLLAALHSALPASLAQQQQRLQQQTSSAAAAAGADMPAWSRTQAQALAVAQLLEPLAGLSSLGQHLGRALCSAAAQRSRQPSHQASSGPAAGRAPPAKPWAAAAAVNARRAPVAATASPAAAGDQQPQQQPQRQAMHGLYETVSLLQLAVDQGDQLLAALAGATAAGVLSGCLESLGVALSGPAQQPQQQPQQQRQQQHTRHHHRHGRNQQQGAAAGGGSGGSSELELQPLWQQELEQQVVLLLQALQCACGKQQAASALALCALSEQLLGQAYSRTMVAHGSALQLLLQQQSAWHAAWPGQQQQQQQQQQGLYSLSGLLCSLAYIHQQSCSIVGVLYHAGCCADASAANNWLSRQQQLQAPHEVGAAVRWLAAAAAQLQPPALLLPLLQAMRAAAAALGGSYSCFLQRSAASVVQAVDSSALRQQLDRTFALHVAMLASISDQLQRQRARMVKAAQPADSGSSKGPASGRDADAAAAQDQPVPAAAAAAMQHSEWHQLQAAVVSQGLAGLSELQFCRVQLPAYVELLTQLVAALAGNAAAADAFVAALPCYDALLHPAAASEGAGQQQHSSTTGNQSLSSSSGVSPDQPRKWLADAVTVARLSFLLPLIPVACRASSAPQQSAAAVLPLLLLLAPHPLEQLARAAHAAFASLFSGAAAAAASATDDAEDPAAAAAWPAQRQQDLLVQAVPFYLQRSLVALPAGGSCQGFATGFHCLLTELPVAHPVMLLVVERVASKVLQLAAEQQQQQPLPHELLPAAAADAGSNQPGQAATDQLFELLQMALQLVDYQLLPTVLQQVAGCVLAAPAAGLQDVWLSRLHGACLATEDQTRKTALLVWLDGLSRQLMQQQQQQQRWQLGQQVAGATEGVDDN